MANYQEERNRNNGKTEQPEPKPSEVTVDNITTEALAETLHNNPYGVVCFQDELSGWFGSFNQYKSKGNDLQFYLSIHSGSAVKINRKSRGDDGLKTRFIATPALSIGGGIQPGVLSRLAKSSQDYWEGGLMARFLWTVPPDEYQGRSVGLRKETLSDYGDVIARLFTMRDANTPEHPLIITMTDEAASLFDDFCEKTQQERPRLDAKLKATWAKLVTNAARL